MNRTRKIILAAAFAATLTLPACAPSEPANPPATVAPAAATPEATVVVSEPAIPTPPTTDPEADPTPPAEQPIAEAPVAVEAPAPVVPVQVAQPAAPEPVAPSEPQPEPEPETPSGYGCDAAIAYLQANAHPAFTIVCPGYAYGGQAVTCLNHAPQCAGQAVIIINVPCEIAYKNEAANSWTLYNQTGAAIDPFGASC